MFAFLFLELLSFLFVGLRLFEGGNLLLDCIVIIICGGVVRASIIISGMDIAFSYRFGIILLLLLLAYMITDGHTILKTLLLFFSYGSHFLGRMSLGTYTVASSWRAKEGGEGPVQDFGP